MEHWRKRIIVPSVVLLGLTALLFALMWIPGVIQFTTYEGAYDTTYFNPFANDYYSVISGVITGLVLPVLIVFLIFPSYGCITTVAVMLELAAILALVKFPLGTAFQTFSNTPLSFAIGFGTIAAMLLAFYIQKKVPCRRTHNPFTRKQMGICALVLIAAFALTFVKWYWKIEWPDMSIAYGNYYENILSNLSAILAAFAANLALLYCLSLIKGRPSVCGVFSLLSVCCTIAAVAVMNYDYSAARVVVLLPAYIISAVQVAVGLRLLFGKRRETNISADVE